MSASEKLSPAFDPRADIADGVAHDLVGGLFGERLQRLHDGNARVNHRGELPGENNQIGERHFAAFGLPALGDLFLDLDHQQVAVKQGGDGGLLRGGLDRVAQFAASGRFAGGVSVYHTNIDRE